MQEVILKKKNNGIAMLLLFILLYLAGIGALVLGVIGLDEGSLPAALAVVLLTVGIAWVTVGWLPFLGLKIVKPQEAAEPHLCR